MRIFLSGFIFLCAFSFAVNAQSDIRQVDFKNFTFEPYCAGEDPQMIKVSDGEFMEEKEVDGFPDRLFFRAEVADYGDVNGDGKDEAFIISVCNTGGTGNFSEGFIYTVKQGKPVLLTRIEGGDRAYGAIREISVKSGIVTVERNSPGKLGGACCPEAVETTNYKWNGKELIAFGKTETRDLYPVKRITFVKGKSSGTATVKIPGGEFQRFVVGANKNQVMTVRVSPETSSINLRFGDAEVTEDIGFMRAVLQEKGDFTFEVWNSSETEQEFTVTVEIK